MVLHWPEVYCGKKYMEAVVLHYFMVPATLEAAAEGSWVQGQAGQFSETVSHKTFELDS